MADTKQRLPISRSDPYLVKAGYGEGHDAQRLAQDQLKAMDEVPESTTALQKAGNFFGALFGRAASYYINREFPEQREVIAAPDGTLRDSQVDLERGAAFSNIPYLPYIITGGLVLAGILLVRKLG